MTCLLEGKLLSSKCLVSSAREKMCGDFLLLLQGVTGIVYIPVRHGLCVDKY